MIEFHNLPADSPVFIFPIRYAPSQEPAILESWKNFFAQWTSHQEPVRGEIVLDQGYFMIVAVDPQFTIPSGCSKDKLYQFVEVLVKQLDLMPLDTGKFWIKTDQGIQSFSQNELKKAWTEGRLSSQHLLFPTWLTHLGDFRKLWAKPFVQFFPWAETTQVS